MKLIVRFAWIVPLTLIAVLGAVAYLFYFGNSSSGSGVAASACVARCQEKLIEGINTTAGPCLSNAIQENWVCDMAHSPRQSADDLPENQCSAFIDGSAKHFVEVDESCRLIRSK